jgi:hypothetical protein
MTLKKTNILNYFKLIIKNINDLFIEKKWKKYQVKKK